MGPNSLETEKTTTQAGTPLHKRTTPRGGRSAPCLGLPAFPTHCPHQNLSPGNLRPNPAADVTRIGLQLNQFGRIYQVERWLHGPCSPAHHSLPFLLFMGSRLRSLPSPNPWAQGPQPRNLPSWTQAILLSCYHQTKHWKPFKDTGSCCLHPKGESAKRRKRAHSWQMLLSYFVLLEAAQESQSEVEGAPGISLPISQCPVSTGQTSTS